MPRKIKSRTFYRFKYAEEYAHQLDDRGINFVMSNRFCEDDVTEYVVEALSE